jgi:Uma2 family endonuclease
MSVLTPPPAAAPVPPVTESAFLPNLFPLSLYQFSLAQYHALLQQGILKDGDQVELLEGYLVNKMSKNPPHATAVRLLRRALGGLLPAGWFMDSDNPVTTTESEPEPDIVLVRGTEEQYVARHPTAADIGLLIEVADSTLPTDRGVKLRLYARAGLPVYWIVNLVDHQLESYTNPTGPAEEPTYRNRQDFGPDAVVPIVLDGQEVGRLAVHDLLPPAEPGP